MEKNGTTVTKNPKKRTLPASKDSSDDVVSRTRRPKRAAACTDFKDKYVRISEKCSVEAKKQTEVEEEIVALRLTSIESDNESRPTRRLNDFLLYDSDGVSRIVEMLELTDIFITGVILPNDECVDKEKEKGVRCQSFGRVENWSISGYEDGSPVVWISTELADYHCCKPATTYKDIYNYFFQKAHASVAVYKRLSKSAGGDPDISLDELLAAVVRSFSESKFFSCAADIREFVIFQGEFIYNQLAGLDETAMKHESSFAEIPVLLTLMNERSKLENFVQTNGKPSNGALRIDGVSEVSEKKAFTTDQLVDGADEDRKYAQLLQDEEFRKSLQRPKRNGSSATASNKSYIKIDEDEIANDYPLPAYYENSNVETDELLLDDAEYEVDIRDLPRRALHNWALYNSDSRMISLELLPMKPCEDIDVTIFGSGVVTDDDGSWFGHDDSDSSMQGSQSYDPNGMNIFLSQIKEWMIEFGGGGTIYVTLRTDVAWYRLGKPSKTYAPWFAPVLKTARIGISIYALLDDQARIARLSFADVIKRLSALQKNDKAYISSDPMAVERYVVVHGQIILQLFAVIPNKGIQKSPFVIGLKSKMEDRRHTKWTIKKKKFLQKGLNSNLNPRAMMAPKESKRKAMQATTTRLINRIWGEFYSNYSPEDSSQATSAGNEVEKVEDVLEVEDVVENEEDDTEDAVPEHVVVQKSNTPKKIRSSSGKVETRWDGEILGKTSAGEPLYRQAVVGGKMVSVGGAVILEVDLSDEIPAIYFVEYMFESSDHCKMLHGRLLEKGSDTVLGNAANERELFLTNECITVQLKDIKGTVNFEIRSKPWGHQYRKDNSTMDKLDRARAEDRKAKDLPTEYYCKSLYSPERGGFFSLPLTDIGRGSGFCNSCRMREDEEGKSIIKLNVSKTGFFTNGIEYTAEDYVYVNHDYFATDESTSSKTSFKSGRNIGLRAFVVCQLLEIVPKKSKKVNLSSFDVKVRRFYRPEDVSAEKAYASDIRELYCSQDTDVLPPEAIVGKCEVRKKIDMPLCREFPILDHIFFCEHFYDSSKGSLKQLPANLKLKFSATKDDTLLRKKKGKGVESETDSGIVKPNAVPKETCLATLDIFAGCGGLSQGLEKAGVSETKWAIEYEKPAGQAFRQNHPKSTVFVNNCNVILRAIMEKCGDQEECISTTEADELAAKLSEDEKSTLPLPGQVDFINGGPPCQGFSGMNRFSESSWSKVQCQMILAFLSFADYFRPRYFLMENVRTFVSHNKRQTFQLTLASLLEMGYQVRFGILEAGTFGVSQSRKRVFIWAAAPDEVLPEWPEPMHVFRGPKLNIPGLDYAAVRSTESGAPFRPITVRDTIGDLPPVKTGASETKLEYQSEPVSWFQKMIRENAIVLNDHICKVMSELNNIRCETIPKRPGADWRDLPDINVPLKTGLVEKMIPFCLPNSAKRHNQWKGLFGRLDWQGNFPTSITDPQPMGKVGMCFHPDQDRIVTVRECARSQGFPDSYEFWGSILDKHRQVGNAVPPPLAYALGRKLKEALRLKNTLQSQP